MDALAFRPRGPILISEYSFLEFQMRRKNAWLELHKPELLERFKLSDFELHLVEQGNEVELAARALWYGILVTTVDDEACRETKGLICASHRDDRIDIPFCMGPYGIPGKSAPVC
jgi:hypothetical protein